MTPQHFPVRSWYTPAAYVMCFVQLGIGAWLLAFAEGRWVLTVMGIVGIISGLWIAYLGYWISKSPLVSVDEAGITLRVSPVRKNRTVEWSVCRALIDTTPGYLIIDVIGQSTLRLPITAITNEDAAKLREAVVSKVGV